MSAADAGAGRYVAIGEPGTQFDAYWIEPDQSNAKSATLVLLHEIFGITDKIRRYAQDYAQAGLHVLVPDLFWRIERRVEIGHDRESIARAMERMKQFDEAAAIDDIAGCIAWARQQRPGAPVALAGFCLGGMLAVKTRTQNMADRYVAYYGVGVEKITASLDTHDTPLLMHVGSDDPYVPRAAVEAYAPKLGAHADVHFYEGAGHAFYLPWRDEPSKLSRQRTLDFLAGART
jgi:carboxymethylenebutenolidase